MKLLATKLDPRTDWPAGASLFEVIWFRGDAALTAARGIFPGAALESAWLDGVKNGSLLVRHQNLGVMHPKTSSLARVLGAHTQDFEVDEVLVLPVDAELSPAFLQELEWTWKEPSIESLKKTTATEYLAWRKSDPQPRVPRDDSWDAFAPGELGLPFTPDEERVLLEREKTQGRPWTRAEWELFAQTWSEHCKHKIFNAVIRVGGREVNSIFKTHIRAPSLEVAEKRDDCLSMFHDNAGVVRLKNYRGENTEWAVCSKMETHNSPSAISPFGGAATGIVGVHRDILGTGLGAKPIANWNVLCFEPDEHAQPRPENALPPRVIRAGVLRGIEVGGNHSGIPTVQGSVHFDASYAVKPYVFAGALGLMKVTHVDKNAAPGNRLYCIGGATGVDGVRGAVMSSRSLEEGDFVGSAVQVANPFVQRSLTDFLLRARDEGLIDSITDNGAGGLASSVGEMSLSTGGAKIDLSNLRLKVKSIPAWIRLLSESQERMTVATSKPEAFEALARRMQIEWDELGELNDSGRFEVTVHGKKLVDVELEFLHEACPKLELRGEWTRTDEESAILEGQRRASKLSPQDTLEHLFVSDELCSREGIVRRFDHEVQGRTLRKPYNGAEQRNPAQGAIVEIPEASGAAVVLTHAAYPEHRDVKRATELAFFETASKAVATGVQWGTLSALDNYAWPDPTNHAHSLSQLVDSAESLARLARTFEIPFVSGKDSMKNNSAVFRARPAVLLSMTGSARSPELVPSSYLQRPNDIVALLPALEATLLDSALARLVGLETVPTQIDYRYVAGDQALMAQVKARYLALGELIAQGNVRSLRTVGRGGVLGSLVKMSFGTSLGMILHAKLDDPLAAYGEGIAGFVMTLDPHHVEDAVRALPGLLRLGVVSAERVLTSDDIATVDLERVERTYRAKSEKGLWR
ncbi:MAG TPA: AIR synthase-related protein [Bdellovibrionota bacterium]|nr:AIR synthase-related protein [Bdellovibrionota bacterium]